jgi:hypothetical protein
LQTAAANALSAEPVSAGESARGRPWISAPTITLVLTLTAGLCASLPVLVAAAHALHAGWQPVADRGIIATRAFDVFSSHTPLVGQYSFAGTVTGHLTYSLGPMLYWLLAPAAHVGAPASLVLTMTSVNVASILGTVALARRRGGLWLMLATATAIPLMCRSLASSNFYDIWNPSAGLFPLMLLIFASWSLACGEYRLAPLVLLLASFCAQCEDAFLPPSLGLVAVGFGGLALSRGWLRQLLRGSRRLLRGRRARTASPGHVQPAAAAAAPSERRRVRRWMLAGLLVLLAAWTPTTIDQVAHSGNLEAVVRAAAERKSSLGPTVGTRAVIHMVGLQPWWLTHPTSPWVRKLDVRRPASLLGSVSSLLLLGWLALAAGLALRRRRGDVAAGAVTALMLCVAVWAIADATPTTPLLAATLGYTLWWASIGGMFVWLIAAWSAVALLGGRTIERLAAIGPLRAPVTGRASLGRVLATVAGVGAVVLGVGVGVAAGEPDEHDYEFPALGAINARLGAVPKGHTVLLAARLDGVVTPLRPEITFALRRRGVRALGTGAYLRLGRWYEKSDHPYDRIIWIYDHGPPPLPGGTVLARVTIGGSSARHTVTVVMGPAGGH